MRAKRRSQKNKKEYEKSRNVKDIKKSKKRIKIILAILFILTLLIIFPSKKKYIIYKYKNSINKLSNKDKYNVKLKRKRDTYSETIRESQRLYDEYLVRLDVNILEYINLKNNSLITFYEKSNKKIEEKIKKKKKLNLRETMYFPLLNNEKISKIKIEEGEYNKRQSYIISYIEESSNKKLYIDKETYYPLAFEIEIDKKKIIYEYYFILNKVDENKFNQVKKDSKDFETDQDEIERLKNKKENINHIGIN